MSLEFYRPVEEFAEAVGMSPKQVFANSSNRPVGEEFQRFRQRFRDPKANRSHWRYVFKMPDGWVPPEAKVDTEPVKAPSPKPKPKPDLKSVKNDPE